MKKLLLAICVAFFIFFISKSMVTIVKTSLHDFDEANRAETAKNMATYHQYLVPLIGSPFELGDYITYTIKNSYPKNITYHFERTSLVFWSMIVSSKIFGDHEFSYRLPSLIFGLATFFTLFYFVKKFDKKFYIFPFIVSFAAFMTSYDWWLSSQNALMDTALSLFLFIALSSLMIYMNNKKGAFLYITGLGISLAIFAKGQPAVIIIPPIVFLFLIKKLNLKEVFKIFIVPFISIFLYLSALSIKFDISKVVSIFIDFARTRTFSPDTTQQAPFFWYLRWWSDTLRFAFPLFVTLVFYDVVKKKIDLKKSVLISYIVPGLLLFSLAANKVWWYVLPLIPAVCFYIYLSTQDLFTEKRFFILPFLIFIDSLPVLIYQSNRLAIGYEVILIIINFALLYFYNKKSETNYWYLTISIFLSLFFFSLRFPTINPTYPENRNIGKYFQDVKGENKCLYVKDMPYESILYYSHAEVVEYLTSKSKLDKKCQNFLVTPTADNKMRLVYQYGRLYLYRLK